MHVCMCVGACVHGCFCVGACCVHECTYVHMCTCTYVVTDY